MDKWTAEDLAELRRLDDGRSRPITILERKVCGRAANEIELLQAEVKRLEQELDLIQMPVQM